MQIFEVIDSTQLEAQRQIDAKGVIPEDIILAYEQTNGLTAHQNKTWNSKKGDFLASFIYYLPTFDEKTIKHTLFVCGLAIREVLLKQSPQLNLQLKWVNDVIVDEKKICGVIESFYKNHLILGVGINLISHPEKTDHLSATDFLTETGITLKPEEVAVELNEKIKQQMNILNQYGFGAIRTKWKQSAYMLGGKLKMRDSGIVLFEDIDDNGNMIVKRENDERQVVLSSDLVECSVKE